MERYDIAIIGTGPAGLEAAITSKVRNKNIILIGNKSLSTKIEKAHTIQNYLGLPDISGEELRNRFQKHVKELNIDIVEDTIVTVYAMGDYFVLQGHENMYEAKTVILACGVFVAKPFVGEIENLGRGVSYCATCDATLYKGKKAIVIGYAKEEEKEANFLSEIANEVIYIPMYPEVDAMNENVMVLKGLKPIQIQKQENQIVLKTDQKDLEADGLFILRENVAPEQLVPGLQIENNQVVVDKDMRTNISGLFACGDITGTPYQYIKAAGQGNVAALSAIHYLATSK